MTCCSTASWPRPYHTYHHMLFLFSTVVILAVPVWMIPTAAIRIFIYAVFIIIIISLFFLYLLSSSSLISNLTINCSQVSYSLYCLVLLVLLPGLSLLLPVLVDLLRRGLLSSYSFLTIPTLSYSRLLKFFAWKRAIFCNISLSSHCSFSANWSRVPHSFIICIYRFL